MKKTNSILGLRKVMVLNRSKNTYMLMHSITEEEEQKIDKVHDYFIGDVTIPNSDIYLYGTVDLNSKSDIKFIQKKPIVSEDVYDAAVIITSFDYDKGTITTNDKGTDYPWAHTWDRLKWFKYNYCWIGKPERVIIYKCNGSTKDRIFEIWKQRK